MTLGEVIGRVCNWLGDDYDNAIKATTEIYDISIEYDNVVIHFVDGNTPDAYL